MLALLLAPLLVPHPAQAFTLAQPTVIGETDSKTGTATVCPGGGLTTRLIACVRDSIIYATANTIGPISDYLAKTIAIACMLAVVLWGVKVMGGKPVNLSADGMVLGIKIGAVMFFTASFGGMFPVMLNALEGLLSIVAAPALSMLPNEGCQVAARSGGEAAVMGVWDIVDCYINSLIGGIFSEFTLSFGIVGFLVGILLSSPVGLFIALMGFYMIGLLLLAVARALYIFITSYIAFAIMVIISPLFIPTILFKSTKGYFDQWLKLTVSFMLQPVFMFAFLVMFLAAFNSTVYTGQYSLYYAIAGEASRARDFKLGEWLLDKANGGANSVYVEQSLDAKAITVNPKAAIEEMGGLKKMGAAPDLIGTQGSQPIPAKAYENNSVFKFLGTGTVGGSYDIKGLHAFKSDIPLRAVDMKKLASRANVATDNCKPGADLLNPTCTNPDSSVPSISGGGKEDADAQTRYKIRVFLAFLMAVITMYIFYSMLEYLPYIGSGISGDGMGVPFGTGRLSVPGTNKGKK